MFKIGKQKSEKKEKISKSMQPEINPELEKQIHVMPQRFYVASKKKRFGLVAIIIGGILLIGVLVAFAIYLNFSLKQTQEPLVVNTNQPINTNINQPVSPSPSLGEGEEELPPFNENQNQNFNTNTATTTAVNANANVNVDINANLNTNTNTNIDVSSPLVVPLAPDIDNDGLTLAEENLFGTNPEISDSDGDNYSDGSEILNGYDPTKPATTLANSELFFSYNHPLYSIIYPRSWELREQDEEKNEVLFITATGEFVEVLVIPNVGNLPLINWYQQQFPEIELAQTTAVKINNLSGLRHPNNQSYYLMAEGDLSRIFILTYNIGNFTTTNFLTTFQAMAKNFRLLP